jgi:hypothetical protein
MGDLRQILTDKAVAHLPHAREKQYKVRDNRRATGERRMLGYQSTGAGAGRRLAAMFTSSASEPAFIFRITLPR